MVLSLEGDESSVTVLCCVMSKSSIEFVLLFYIILL